MTFLAASAAPTPLYGTYAEEWGFSAVTTTVVFGVYAFAVLVALLVLGRLADHVGRRPVLLAAVALQALAAAAFLLAEGVPGLIVARVVQGVGNGVAAGAVGAALIDVDERRGTLVNAVGAPVGTGVGALGAALVVEFLPAPTQSVYWLLLGLCTLQFAGVLFVKETAPRRPGALRSLRPEFALPASARRALLVVTPALVAAWALPGFFGSLAPGLLRVLSGSDAVLLGGLPFFLLAFGGAVSTVTLRNVRPDQVMLTGVTVTTVGVGAGLATLGAGSAPWFLATVAVAGFGFGAAFQGGLRVVMPLARDHERAGLLSLVYVICYLAVGLPAVLAGLLTVHNHDVILTAVQYGVVVIALSVVAGVGLLASRRRLPPATR